MNKYTCIHIYSGWGGGGGIRFWASLQRKGRWKSNLNVWFPIMYFHKWNFYFQNRIIKFCLPVHSHIYLWEIFIFPGSVCLFCCREICGPILGIYKSLTDTRMWKLGLRPCNPRKGIHKWDFPCSAQKIKKNLSQNPLPYLSLHRVVEAWLTLNANYLNFYYCQNLENLHSFSFMSCQYLYYFIKRFNKRKGLIIGLEMAWLKEGFVLAYDLFNV